MIFTAKTMRRIKIGAAIVAALIVLNLVAETYRNLTGGINEAHDSLDGYRQATEALERLNQEIEAEKNR